MVLIFLDANHLFDSQYLSQTILLLFLRFLSEDHCLLLGLLVLKGLSLSGPGWLMASLGKSLISSAVTERMLMGGVCGWGLGRSVKDGWIPSIEKLGETIEIPCFSPFSVSNTTHIGTHTVQVVLMELESWSSIYFPCPKLWSNHRGWIKVSPGSVIRTGCAESDPKGASEKSLFFFFNSTYDTKRRNGYHLFRSQTIRGKPGDAAAIFLTTNRDLLWEGHCHTEEEPQDGLR